MVQTEERRKYNRDWYANSSVESKERKMRLQKERKQRIAAKVCEYKANHPCVDCGEPDPIVLQFDHVNDDKEFNIADAAGNGVSWKIILKEIAKCEVRCANCHIRITYKRRMGL